MYQHSLTGNTAGECGREWRDYAVYGRYRSGIPEKWGTASNTKYTCKSRKSNRCFAEYGCQFYESVV